MKEDILQLLHNAERPLSSADISKRLGKKQRNVQVYLKKLIEENCIFSHGRARAKRYQIAQLTPQNTVGWNEDFLLDYIPNHSFYLDEQTRERLKKRGAPRTNLPAGTYARRILDRLLIDLSWNSSRLEGNTYSLLDTEKLLASGEVEGQDALETQMILNHKDAIQYLLDDAESLQFSPFTIRSLHGILSSNLLADPASSGALRHSAVGISGSQYIPLAHPQRIENAFEKICEIASTIRDPFEASFFSLIHIPYLQPFIDVNKRVSRLAANIPFIKKSYYPLSFVDTDRNEYLKSLLKVYESQNINPIRTLFINAYESSAEKYLVIANSIAEPDPFRLKHRIDIKRAIAFIVREHIDKAQIKSIQELIDLSLPPDLLPRFIVVLEEELRALHMGNIARYRLRPSEFESYQASV